MITVIHGFYITVFWSIELCGKSKLSLQIIYHSLVCSQWAKCELSHQYLTILGILNRLQLIPACSYKRPECSHDAREDFSMLLISKPINATHYHGLVIPNH